MSARYFTSADWSGPPARLLVQDDIRTSQLSRAWGFTPPDTFSAQWSGFLYVDRSGPITFATTSDDGSRIHVDGRLAVENGGAHGLTTRSGTTQLEAGPHAVLITYFNGAGAYQFDWAWAEGDEPLHAVSSWRLSTRPRGYAALVLIGALDWLSPIAAAFALVAGLWLIVVRARRSPGEAGTSDFRLRKAPALACLGLFAAAAVVQTWPLARDPAHLSRNDNADTMLNEWAIAWVAHELPRAPAHLFDANMFYPETHTLAYSETLVVQGVMAAPMFALGASPVLAYNLVLLAGFVLTAWSTSLLVARWTEDWIAGAAAGLMAAFNAHTLTRLPHLQAQHVEFLPLALLALDSLLRRPRWKQAWLLALWFVLEALTSAYLLVFSAIALTIGFLVRPEDWAGRRGIAIFFKLACAALVAAIALAPFLLPYWELQKVGQGRSLDEAGYFAASMRDYLTTPGRFHTWLGGRSALFPGFAAIALAAIPLATGAAFRDARARMCLAFGACGVLLSFGPVVPGYEFFFSTVPLFQGIRTSSRFGYLGLFAVAVLGGYGIAILRRKTRAAPRVRLALSAFAILCVFLDPLAAPLSYADFSGIPSIYRLPAQHARAVVAEMPLAPPEFQYRDASALLNSTANWRPLLNGYSGLTPPGYVQRYIAMNHFPDADAVGALQRAGVTDVFVHTSEYDASALDAIAHTAALHEVAAEGAIVLYSLAPPER